MPWSQNTPPPSPSPQTWPLELAGVPGFRSGFPASAGREKQVRFLPSGGQEGVTPLRESTPQAGRGNLRVPIDAISHRSYTKTLPIPGRLVGDPFIPVPPPLFPLQNFPGIPAFPPKILHLLSTLTSRLPPPSTWGLNNSSYKISFQKRPVQLSCHTLKRPAEDAHILPPPLPWKTPQRHPQSRRYL